MTSTIDLVRLARTDLRPRLDRVLNSQEDLARIAARSYSHDNGFVKIVLAGHTEAESALRLHIWPSHATDDGNIHNHCWDFISLVLMGGLEFEEFGLDATGPISAEHFAYAPSSDFAYELQPLGQTKLRRSASGVRRSGEFYKMSAETLHRTWGLRETTTATLVSRGRHRRKKADVLVTRPGGVPTEATNDPLDVEQVKVHLAKISAELASKPL